MKLSIVTINRNNAKGLQKTIESVLSQIFSEIEYVIIDGGSTDESVQVIKLYASKISYWVSELDTGIYNAMNKGILNSRGEYLLFLNSGDWLVENVLNDIDIESFNEDIVYGNIIVEYENDLRSVSAGCAKKNLTFYDFYNDTIRHQAAFIKRNLLLEAGLYNENYTIISDWLFFVNTIVYGNAKIKYIDVNISHFDAYGIGNTETAQIERKNALELLLPKKIIDDYEIMNENIDIIKNLYIELNRYKNRFYYIDLIISKVKDMLIKKTII
jgi:glycosyltransferase involved in cell wall biosynthesis